MAKISTATLIIWALVILGGVNIFLAKRHSDIPFNNENSKHRLAKQSKKKPSLRGDHPSIDLPIVRHDIHSGSIDLSKTLVELKKNNNKETIHIFKSSSQEEGVVKPLSALTETELTEFKKSPPLHQPSHQDSAYTEKHSKVETETLTSKDNTVATEPLEKEGSEPLRFPEDIDDIIDPMIRYNTIIISLNMNLFVICLFCHLCGRRADAGLLKDVVPILCNTTKGELKVEVFPEVCDSQYYIYISL